MKVGYIKKKEKRKGARVGRESRWRAAAINVRNIDEWMPKRMIRRQGVIG